MDELERKVRMLLALPPFDSPANICANDGYFYRAIIGQFGEGPTERMVQKLKDGKHDHAPAARPTDDLKRPAPPVTPLIDRLKVIERENYDLVTFVKWLDVKGRLKNPGRRSYEDIVAEYRGIDLRAVARERKLVTDYAAAMQTYWFERDKRDAESGD